METNNPKSDHQDTGKFRKNLRDQFFTKPAIAQSCIQSILSKYPDLVSTHDWIDPSAGSGVFGSALAHLNYHPTLVTIDLIPKGPGILEQNFLTWFPAENGKPRIIFGNPPFGRQGKAARQFIKHSVQIADTIAFILPRSFEKPSMWRAFPRDWFCELSESLSENAFEVNGVAYNVPCVFQIWRQRSGQTRPTTTSTEPQGFRFVAADDQDCDIVVRRVGVYAGRAYLPTDNFSAQSHYFIELAALKKQEAANVVAALNSHVFPSNTTGPRSLSKGEITEVLNEILDS
jgi:predicted RNA methylase